MKSTTTAQFWKLYHALPVDVQRRADRAYKMPMMVCSITIMGIFSYGWKIQPICLRPYHHRQIQPEHAIARLVGDGRNPHHSPPRLRDNYRANLGR